MKWPEEKMLVQNTGKVIMIVVIGLRWEIWIPCPRAEGPSGVKVDGREKIGVVALLTNSS